MLGDSSGEWLELIIQDDHKVFLHFEKIITLFCCSLTLTIVTALLLACLPACLLSFLPVCLPATPQARAKTYQQSDKPYKTSLEKIPSLVVTDKEAMAYSPSVTTGGQRRSYSFPSPSLIPKCVTLL
ncbi:hypothetical protein E2C01_008524 [Portunus trituberculatus]|uniref:Uncharacterized protein n=1 Tax=Portunus trituberculatus TaxID=210409 RepID=A0A5B7D472_PORTR|nr:hypothetical protein [Portunus trituberculatus]